VASLHENPAGAVGRDRELICLVGAASQLAELMDFCEFPEARTCELSQVVELIPDAVSQLADFPALTELVATRVNGIELSLG
jgi:hypothetical protein